MSEIIIDDIDSRPFFSVIVPCYNSKPERIKELLASIYDAGCTDETEVIIVDGGSTDKSYEEEIQKVNTNSDFLDEDSEIKLNIKSFSLPQLDENGDELIHCPGNTREYGVQQARGRWITFIDHDDLFNGQVFTKIKSIIEETDEQYVVFSNILQVNPENREVIQEIKYASNWMHGKFYNLDNFWKANNFHFKKNLFANEDIYVSSRVHCVLHLLGKDEVVWLPDFMYIWRAYEDSTSHVKYSNELNYMEYHFYDYLEATYKVYVDEYNKLTENGKQISEEDREFLLRMQVDSLLFQYFYLQSFKFNNKNWLFDHEKTVKQNFRDFYARFNMPPEYFYQIACEKLDNDDIRDGGFATKIWYNSVRYSVTISCGNFIETDNFKTFISSV